MAENLDTLTSKELHDRAVKHAVRHGDLKFLWRLLEQIPAAEETAGTPGEGEADIVNLAALLHDYAHSGEGEIADALRPTYLDYLAGHHG
jgi:hypothetical protein